MAMTPYLNLSTVGMTGEEIEMKFQDWRLLIAGDSNSNMNKIDTGYYTLFTKINDVDSRTEFITNNGLGSKFLADDGTYKIVEGGGGGTVAMTDSFTPYTATEDVDSFTIEGVTGDSQVLLYKDNLLMIKDVDYTINKETGEISLPFTLTSGEIIYYQINKAIDKMTITSLEGDITTATSVYLLDSVGNVVSTKTKKEDVIGIDELEDNVNNKVSVQDVVDNLATDISGKVLDAKQGKILADMIGDLSLLTTEEKVNIVEAINETLGVANEGLKFKGVCARDLSDTLLSSGIWITEITDELTNIPSWWSTNTYKTVINFGTGQLTDLSFMLIIDSFSGEVCYQQGEDFYWSSLTNPTRFNFYASAKETVTIVSQECYVVGQELTVNLRLRRIEDTSFDNMVVASVPMNFAPSHYIVGSAMGKGLTGDYSRIVNCFLASDGGIRVIPQEDEIGLKEIVLTIKGGFLL